MDLLKLGRTLLAAAALLAPGACYEPRLATCAVRCSSDKDCAPGQTCGDQGFCTAPELACAPSATDAAATDGPTGPTVDGKRPDRPDARPKALLRAPAAGGGEIHVDGGGPCDSEGWANGDCRFAVDAGISE